MSSLASHRPLTTGPASMLVAEREITTQVRGRSFIVSLLITVLILGGGILLMGLVGGEDESPAEVAVVGEAGSTPQGFEEQLGAAGLDPMAAGDREEAEELLRDEQVEAILLLDEESPAGVVVVGLDEEPVEVAQLLSVSPPTEVLEEAAAEGPERFLVPILFGLVFMMLSMGSGMMIMQNTVQEKQSRIVEILLAAISSRALLIGKILGNSVLALAQAIVLGAASALALMLSGQQDLLDMLTVPMLWFVLFFLPGFVLVASVFAASAALVSRQEDIGAVATPAMMIVMLPYFAVVFFYDNNLVMTIASYVPFSAPVAMPVRMFFNEAQWFEPILTLGLLAATTAVFALVAAKIYSRSLLRTGQRVPLRQALSSQS